MYKPKPRTFEGKTLEGVTIARCTLYDETSNIPTRCEGNFTFLNINPLLITRKLGYIVGAKI